MIDSVIAFFDMAEVVALVTLLALALVLRFAVGRARERRRGSFWCRLAQREVEVEFEKQGLPGFRRLVAKRCSACDPPEAIACRRQCTQAAFRRQWEFALPVTGRGEL